MEFYGKVICLRSLFFEQEGNQAGGTQTLGDRSQVSIAAVQ
ncbi:hypothetical protein [Phormidium nigroviride]